MLTATHGRAIFLSPRRAGEHRPSPTRFDTKGTWDQTQRSLRFSDLVFESPRMQPAQSLADAAKFLKQEALDYDSPLYADLRAARATKELDKLEVFLSNAAATPNAFAKAAFIGNRGSGKSTYLLHLEHDLQQKGLFTPLHVYLDASLESDCDYSDLFLWIVDEIARQFKERGHPVDDVELAKVATWFAEKSLVHSTDWKKEIGIETEASASAKSGLPGILSFKILARLKSMIVGSETSRKTMRQNVQNYGRDLLELVNDFLDHSRPVLFSVRPESRNASSSFRTTSIGFVAALRSGCSITVVIC